MENPENNSRLQKQESTDPGTPFSLLAWIEAGKPAGASLLLEGEDELAEHYSAMLSLKRITINFAGFMDGRGFSHAGKLRQMGFEGELVAGGDVLADQWVFLRRCGFDSICDENTASGAHALPGFTEAYQADAREREPLFRRKRSI